MTRFGENSHSYGFRKMSSYTKQCGALVDWCNTCGHCLMCGCFAVKWWGWMGTFCLISWRLMPRVGDSFWLKEEYHVFDEKSNITFFVETWKQVCLLNVAGHWWTLVRHTTQGLVIKNIQRCIYNCISSFSFHWKSNSVYMFAKISFVRLYNL